MARKYTPAIFQANIRPAWAGIISYIGTEEKALILEALLQFPQKKEIKSKFWNETIKPDLENQHMQFIESCLAKGRGSKSYWETKDKEVVNISLPCDKEVVNSVKSKDKIKDKDKSNSKDNNYAFEGKIIKLTQKDWNSWVNAYPELNIYAECLVRDDYLATLPEKEQKNWFMSTARYFVNQNEFRKKQHHEKELKEFVF